MNEQTSPSARKRSVTELTIGWIAEKLRKTEELKKQISSGTYKVNTKKVAEAILNEDKEN